MELNFTTPPTQLTLQPGDLHLWRIPLDGDLPPLDELSEEERRRATRYLHEADRRRFANAHHALHRILADYLGADPAGITFAYEPRGKPFLAGNPLLFNLAHAGELALLGVCLDKRIGVDLEYLERKVEIKHIAPRFFSPDEARIIASLQGKEQRLAFFSAWTRKEAYIKATGEGLAQPLDGFTVSVSMNEPARLLWVDSRPEEAARWSLLSFDPDPAYLAAVAMEGNISQIYAWDFDPA